MVAQQMALFPIEVADVFSEIVKTLMATHQYWPSIPRFSRSSVPWRAPFTFPQLHTSGKYFLKCYWVTSHLDRINNIDPRLLVLFHSAGLWISSAVELQWCLNINTSNTPPPLPFKCHLLQVPWVNVSLPILTERQANLKDLGLLESPIIWSRAKSRWDQNVFLHNWEVGVFDVDLLCWRSHWWNMNGLLVCSCEVSPLAHQYSDYWFLTSSENVGRLMRCCSYLLP